LLLGMALVLGVAAAASAAALTTTFPAAGHAAHGHAGGIGAGDQVTLRMPLGGLAPGQTARGRPVVANGEGRSLRYSLSSASVDADHKGVRDVLRVTIRLADPASGAAATCNAFDGVLLYRVPLGANAAGFGDARMGQQPGDRILAAGQRETICIEIGMPLDAGNAYQGAATATTWTIAAEQEDGNP